MRQLARINRYLTNPAFRALAARLPGYANVVHIGRRTGRHYRTPVGITRHHDEIRIALNYGRHSDWVRNVLAVGDFELEHRGRTIALTDARVARLDGRDFLLATTEPD
ncbi:nitroreductase family deazaflavin-dependent oxidoreductase [Nocardia uniformis]|uniref:Nitroreductase family deazaflavin-dependent oxidoreductase n=1 Tax=Nocardia uniformis TaxID=53432 RepID=A0A849BW90_9NOCA|nr:nitroreductase family deazaflavin-dependent oxidoreductase [Nocardia uniformis]NNH70484.1 nitroreductase family deazaflavin-dependent oxidoreductase [Nocardia uniformis]